MIIDHYFITNSKNPDQMPYNVASDQGLHRLSRYHLIEFGLLTHH